MDEPTSTALLTTLLVGLLAAASAALWWSAGRRLLRGRPALRWRRRRPVPWGPDGAALAFFCVGTALLGAFAPSDDAGPPMTLRDAAGYALVALALGGGSALWLRATAGATPADFGLASVGRRTTGLADDLTRGLGVCIAMLLPVYLIQTLLVLGLGAPSGHPTIQRLLENPTPESVAAAVVVAVIVAPLFEEFAFRVLLQGWLERLGGSRRAAWPVVASAAAFAVAHQGQGYAPVALFVLALGLGYLYRQTHRLAPCVVAHAAFNALSLGVALASASLGRGP